MKYLTLSLFLIPLLLAGCGDEPAELPTLPVTYSGELPCSDCEAMEVTLTLRPDSLFLMRQVYRTAGDTRRSDYIDFGSWDITADNQLMLKRGTEPPRLYQIEEGKLSQLDNLERTVLEDHELTRDEQVDPIEDSFMMRGLYSHYATTAEFVECETMMAFPIAVPGDDSLIQAAYADTSAATVDTLLMTFYGHLEVMKEAADASEMVIVDSLVGVWPDMRCTDRLREPAPVPEGASADTVGM